MQTTTHNSWRRLAVRAWLGFVAVMSAATGAQAQTYYYYPTTAMPAYSYWPGGVQGQMVWPGYDYSYYPATYSTPTDQAAYSPWYYQVAYTQPTAPASPSNQPVQPVAAVPTTAASQKNPEKTEAQKDPAVGKAEAKSDSAPASDPYGFLNWLNSTRASYGLPAVGYDPDLESWAAMNNNHQAARGMGHFVMGPALRQNAATGSFPGIESMWMASPAHRAALLDPTIRWIGIAGLGAYWTFNAR